MIPFEKIKAICELRGHTLEADEPYRLDHHYDKGYEHQYHCKNCELLMGWSQEKEEWHGELFILNCGDDAEAPYLVANEAAFAELEDYYEDH